MRKDNFTRVRRTWLGLLNIVLAIATSLRSEGDLPAGKRIQESDIYIQRANGLCDRDSKRNASLEMVQYLLILGQYLQGTQKSVLAWTTHGLAISAAFQLGLHSPEANRRFSSLEGEIRKRTWHGCPLIHVIYQNTQYDIRPTMYYSRIICETGDASQRYASGWLVLLPRQCKLNYSAPVWAVNPCLYGVLERKLYVVMFNVLDSCYCQNPGFDQSFSTASIVPQILEGERQLEEWYAQTESELGIRLWHELLLAEDLAKMDQQSTICHLFGIVLSVRYHNLRILLYHEFLESFLGSCSHGPAQSTAGFSWRSLITQIEFTGVQNCIESAKSIISTVHTITSSIGWQRGLLGAWNYSLYYIEFFSRVVNVWNFISHLS
ncbi:transcriptional regulatory protein GAL4 [Penicillium argentinense]|uniref:Transcriptional regulatory protein GAL4 n=1 Tax=Penicillium argentinense TaxID=1131581 RepID=A0A9W9FFD2_9EURO|nr:transcriptional regulatory protein GAL4 [Penicillium argentinense]KAJ5099147.1 transcriptional regulatory protein GAL4 [Penicillium argentinense]